MEHFDYQILDNDFKTIVLKAQNEQKKSLIKIAPEFGNNMYEYQINNHSLIYHNPELPLAHFLNGNPIIYPLPNRVKNCHFEYKGNKYWQEKNSKPIFLHSLVFDEKWDYHEPEIRKDYIQLETFMNIDKNHPVYEGFPFEHKIKIFFKLFVDKLRIKYEITNHDNKELPYGICFHTYFNYLTDRDKTYIKAPAQYFMELDDDQIPTGELKSVKNTDYDFNEFKSLKGINIDGAITNLKGNAQINFEKRMEVLLDSSDEFTHIQFYTPLDEPFFCLEMQTCSADAHNLDAAGYEKAAHLLTIKPDEKSSGWLDYKPKLC